MKSYKEVVDNRYNNRDANISVWENIYSELNPIGLHQAYKIKKVFTEIFRDLKSMEIDFTMSKILDVGCGEGGFLRYIAELKGNCKDLYGLDMSQVRINKADSINPQINYFIGDMVEFKDSDIKFNIITAINVFMHLNTKDEIIDALTNIYSMLESGGVFIWYDAYWESHFNALNESSESCGFNIKEMNEYASMVGFKDIISKEVGKYILNDISLSTAYLGGQFETWVIDMMEEKLPGLPVNHVVVYRK